MKKVTDMTTGNPAKLLLQFALPVFLGNIFQQMFTMVDKIIVGQFVGAEAFSAVGATNALSLLFMSACIGTSMGIGIVVSHYFGAKEEENTAAAIANGTYVIMAVSLLITIVAELTLEPILHLLNTPEELMRDAVAYSRIYMGSYVVMSAYNGPVAVLRAMGDSKTPVKFLILCSLCNVVLDLIFVVPLHMGVEGAAWATVISQAIAAACCIIYSFKNVPQFRLALKMRKPQKEMMLKTLKVGMPAAFQYALMYISTIILQRVINGFGDSVIGAFTATTQIDSLVLHLYMALGIAMSTYAGQNVGAEKPERVAEGVRSIMKINVAASLAFIVLFWTFGKDIMRIFVTEQEIINIAATGICINSIFYFGMGLVQLFCNLLTGAGDAAYSFINGIVEIIARIGFVIVLTGIPAIGVWGIWFTTGLTWTATGVAAFIRYKGGKWRTKSLAQS